MGEAGAAEGRERRWWLAAVVGALLILHVPVFFFPAGYFATLGADEINDTLGPRARLRAGEPAVLTYPEGRLNGGGILQGTALALVPGENPRLLTVATRALAIGVAAATLALWSAAWASGLGVRVAVIASLLLLFPGAGWITNTVPAFGTHGPSALGAALAAWATLRWLARGAGARGGVALGALLGVAALATPGAAPTVGAAAILLVHRARRAALSPLVTAAVAAFALLALEGFAAGDPLGTITGFVSRPTGDVGLDAPLARAARGLTNFLHPAHVWMLPLPLFYGLLAVAGLGAIRVPERARRIVELHIVAIALTLVAIATTRIADSAAYNSTGVLPHAIGLAALGLARGVKREGVARALAVLLLCIWIVSGARAYAERFLVTEPNLAYASQVVPRAVVPVVDEIGAARVVSSFHLGLVLEFQRPDLELCCAPRSLCSRGCEPGFFEGGPGVFVAPGAAAHLHGDLEAARLREALVELASESDGGATVAALRLDGSVGKAVDDPQASAVVFRFDDGDGALARVLEHLASPAAPSRLRP